MHVRFFRLIISLDSKKFFKGDKKPYADHRFYPAALSADLQMYLRNGDVFFDIETTGLSWRTSHLYLIGALFFDPAADTFTLRQWFLDRPTEEKEMLVSFFTFLSDVKRLVHFNGTTFDLPYLTHKALFYQMEDRFRQSHPWIFIRHSARFSQSWDFLQ